MADKIDTNPFKIISVDTAEHELEIDASIYKNSPIQLALEVTTGTIQFSTGKPISGQSATYSASSNNKCPLTLYGYRFSYKATTIGDAFVGAL